MKAAVGAGWLSSGRAGDRHEWNDERIHPEGDQFFTDFKNGVRGVAQTGEDVGGDLASAEHRDGGGESIEVAGQWDAGLAGHDTRPHRWRNGFEMHAKRVYTGVVHAGEPGIVVRGLALGPGSAGPRRL